MSDLAEWLRDERLTRCDHTTTDEERPLVCSPCLRDRIVASRWLSAVKEAAWNEGAIWAGAIRLGGIVSTDNPYSPEPIPE